MNRFGAIAMTAAFLAACGHLEATDRLKEARGAYAKAAQGPAAQYSPAELATAKKALDQADASLETGDREVVDDKSVVALSKIYAAESIGRTQEAAAQRDAALKELNITRDQLLSQTQEQLDRERQARNTAEAQLAQSRQELERYAQVQDMARGTVITLSGGVLFETGKADLLPGAQDRLSRVASFLKNSPRPVVIEGYTDSRGSPDSNQALSERRARAVSDFLTAQGVPRDRIRAEGKGESSPVATNSTAEGRAQNRRVEIVLERAPAAASSSQPATESGLGGSASPGSDRGTPTTPPSTRSPTTPDTTPASPPTTPR
jgi:outer membrane protein OmpA-like peptidoglycan-associated protein